MVNHRFKQWAPSEDSLIERHYPSVGASGMLARGYLADRTRDAINRRASRIGVRFAAGCEKNDQARVPWPMPTMELGESLACIQFRKWRGPVTHGFIGGRIAA